MTNKHPIYAVSQAQYDAITPENMIAFMVAVCRRSGWDCNCVDHASWMANHVAKELAFLIPKCQAEHGHQWLKDGERCIECNGLA